MNRASEIMFNKHLLTKLHRPFKDLLFEIPHKF